MEASQIIEIIGQFGLDAVVVLTIVAATQLAKRYLGGWLARWLPVIPLGFGLIWGVILNLGDGWIAVVRGAFVYGVVATWLYVIATKSLGLKVPGDDK